MLTGDISSDNPDLCVVFPVPVELAKDDQSPEGTYYIGQWVAGFGFIRVRFPVETTRPLTEEEIVHFEKSYYQLADLPARKMDIRDHT